METLEEDLPWREGRRGGARGLVDSGADLAAYVVRLRKHNQSVLVAQQNISRRVATSRAPAMSFVKMKGKLCIWYEGTA